MPSAVALRYARALADAVASPTARPGMGDPRTLTMQLTEFHALLRENPELRILFSTPAISTAKKKAVLVALAPVTNLSPLAKNFLSVVIDHKRMALLGEITEAFVSLLDERLGVAVAEVAAARPLGEEEKQTLAAALKVRTGKQVRMTVSLDPSLIGGVIARVGSTIYDGSVRGQLQRLRAELKGG